MCDQCGPCDQQCPTPEEVEALVRARLAEQRFTTISVSGSRHAAELSYTVGLTRHGLPELVVTAVRRDDALRLLQLWGDYLLDTGAVLPGETMECGPWLLEAVEVERPDEHLLMACRLYGEGFRALQLAWADGSGRMPWEPGHSARRAGQPLLGRPAPRYCPEHRPDRLDVPPHL